MNRRMLAGALFLLSGCASAPATSPKTSGSPIRHIYVQRFQGDAGAETTQEFVRALAGSGLIVEKPGQADALLTGMVTTYKPARHLIVVLANTDVVLPGGQTVTVSNPVISPGGAQTAPPNAGPQMVLQNAAAGVLARLVDVRGGALLWAQEYGYESLEATSALKTSVDVLAHTVMNAAPRLQHNVQGHL